MKGLIINTLDDPSYMDADEWAFMQDAIIGGSGIAEFAENLSASKIDDNTTRLMSGVYFIRGRAIINQNYVDLNHDSGSLGLKRVDLIIAEYTKNGVSDGTDELQFKVLKGESSATTPVAPDLTNTDTVWQETIYQVNFNGTLLEQIFTIAPIASITANSVKTTDGSNVQEFIDNQKSLPFIVDQVINTDGGYRKYSDGFMEQWGSVLVTFTGASSTSNITTGAIPYIDIPHAKVSARPIDWGCIAVIGGLNANGISSILIYTINAPSNTQHAEIFWETKGRWK